LVDANREVRALLDTIEGVTVTYYVPPEVNRLPAVSYYEVATTTGYKYDNAERAQVSAVAIDIWAATPAKCAEIAISVDAVMQDAGWYRELSRDMPPEDLVRHKSMRYNKQIFF
jgi:hypothetical protein